MHNVSFENIIFLNELKKPLVHSFKYTFFSELNGKLDVCDVAIFNAYIQGIFFSLCFLCFSFLATQLSFGSLVVTIIIIMRLVNQPTKNAIEVNHNIKQHTQNEKEQCEIPSNLSPNLTMGLYAIADYYMKMQWKRKIRKN